MAEILWKPSPERVDRTQMDGFRRFVNKTYDLDLRDYSDLYEWSVADIPDFWAAVWNFMDVIHSQSYDRVVDDLSKMPGARWFPGARLNFSQNLLRFRDDKPALVFQGEDKPVRTLTYSDLYREVARLNASLRDAGISEGDRVAGFMPNMPETVIGLLAAASLGAVWSSSSPDFGIKGVLDRFKQIEPRVLFSADGYVYNGKVFPSLPKLERILHELPSVETVVVVPYTDPEPDLSGIPANAIMYEDFVGSKDSSQLAFEHFPFDHPLTIMYSSGTTGLPKSMVHGAGGTLVQHLKEL